MITESQFNTVNFSFCAVSSYLKTKVKLMFL